MKRLISIKLVGLRSVNLMEEHKGQSSSVVQGDRQEIIVRELGAIAAKALREVRASDPELKVSGIRLTEETVNELLAEMEVDVNNFIAEARAYNPELKEDELRKYFKELMIKAFMEGEDQVLSEM